MEKSGCYLEFNKENVSIRPDKEMRDIASDVPALIE